MIVTPLSGRGPAAIRDALLSVGWEGDLAMLTASGIEVSAFLVQELPSAAVEGLVPVAARLGLELVTGADWVVLAGAHARLGAFARPWVQPEAVQAVAEAIGRALPGIPPMAWRVAGRTIPLDRPVVIGVVNVTPDSFSDGGANDTLAQVLARVDALIAGGATLLDIGGESTRPGAEPVPPPLEQGRILPVLEALARRHPQLPLSVDTVHAATAVAALDAGAVIVNDVTAGRHDPGLLEVVAERGAGVVLSHSRGALGALASYDLADYGGDVTGTVARELAAATNAAIAAGVAPDAIVVDPGFGFGKTPPQNFTLLDQLDGIVALGHPVLVGVSRKRFLAEVTGRPIGDRDRATAAACALAWDRGARLFRVHDPEAVRDALAVASAVHPPGA